MKLLGETPERAPHIWPGRDVFPHEGVEECPCGPILRYVEYEWDSGWAHVHPALDLAAYETPTEGAPRAEH